MRSGTWPDMPVRSTTTRALVNGLPVDLDAVSLTAEMSSDLPIVGGAALAVTDGSISWPQQALVSTVAPQPFLPAAFPPAIGTPLVIEVGDGMGQWFRQVTGRTDSNAGSITSGLVTTRVVDQVDKLSAPVWHNALLDRMPDPDAEVYSYPGLTGTYVFDLCARTAGFYATPKAGGNVRLSVPFMGSGWPEVGKLTKCSRQSTGGLPGWRVTGWGLAPVDVDAEWELNASGSYQPVLTVCLTPQPAGSGTITAYLVDGNDYGCFLAHDEVGDRLRVGVAGGGFATALGNVPRNGNGRAALKASISGTTITLVLRLADGTETTYASTNAAYSGWWPNRCQLRGLGSMGGLVVEQAPASPWAAMASPVTAQVRVGAIHTLWAMPSLRGETALSLITNQAQAECASTWINADGVLIWAGRGVLEAAAPVVTKTTALTVDDLPWSVDLRSVYAQLSLKRSHPARSSHTSAVVLLYQGEVETLVRFQVSEKWVESPAGVDWVVTDKTFQDIMEPVDTFAKALVGSKTGAVLGPKNAEATVGLNFAVSVEADWIGENKALITTTALDWTTVDAGNGVHPEWANYIATTKVSEFDNMPKALQSTGLPILRGKGRIDWADVTDTFPTGADELAAVFNHDHDCSWYLQNATRRSELQVWLCAALSAPRPEFTVSIDADPRIELGDKVTIEDPSRTGLTLDVVVTGIAQSYGSDAPSMTLSGRITRAVQTWSPTDPAPAWPAFIAKWTTQVGGA